MRDPPGAAARRSIATKAAPQPLALSPSNGYELTQRFDDSLGNAWHASSPTSRTRTRRCARSAPSWEAAGLTGGFRPVLELGLQLQEVMRAWLRERIEATES